MAVVDDMNQDPFGGMTAEQIAELIRLGVIPEELAQASADVERGQGLQDAPGVAGTHVNQGRTYIAGNPLEHAARGIRGYQGREQEEEARALAAELRKEQVAGRNKFFEAKMGMNDPGIGTPGINPQATQPTPYASPNPGQKGGGGLAEMLRRGAGSAKAFPLAGGY